MQDAKNRYGVCSRKYDMMDREDNLFWKAAKASRVLNLLPQLTDFPNVAIIGELCGSSIEGNTMNYPEGQHEFIVFSIFDIDKGLYLPPKKTFEMCKELGLKHTPIIGAMTVWEFASNTQKMLDKAEGTGMYGGIREGFVFHSEDGKDHFKVISNSWLLKTGK
jgi:ATP-dependent RNA circularization protein (DNA/RNA ligase family)